MKYIYLLLLFIIAGPPGSSAQEKGTQVYSDTNEALENHKKNLIIARQKNQLEEQSRILLNIATILKRQDTNKSLEHLQEALYISKTIHHHQLSVDISRAIIEIYKEQGNYKEALAALEEHQKLLDSLFRKNSEQAIATIKTTYALEKSQLHIKDLEMANQRKAIMQAIGQAITVIALLIVLGVWLYLRKVRKMNRELEASNMVKDKMFSIIGHDLRGPIGASAQMLKLLETGEFSPEKSQQIIYSLRQQSEASFEIVDSLLNWGKSQLQGVEVNAKNFKPKNIISRNVEVLKNQASVKNIRVNDYTSGEISIYMDPDQFDFIIRNLLSNAIKFTNPEGSVEINADNATRKGSIIFSVKDNGIGISPEKQQEFNKSNMTVAFGTKGEKGTGIGLLLSKEFIKANHGELWLESEENTGTTFYFSSISSPPEVAHRKFNIQQ